MAHFSRRTGPIVSASAWILAILAGALALPLYAADCLWSGADGNWDDPAQWSDCGGGIPGSGDTAIIGAGEVNLQASTTVAGLTMTGGTLIGSGLGMSLSVNDSLLLTGDEPKRIARMTLNNGGAAVWDEGGFTLGPWPDPVNFNNLAGASFEIVGERKLQPSQGSAILNEGTILKTGPDLSDLSDFGAGVRNDGLVRVEEGTLRIFGTRSIPVEVFTHSGSFEMLAGATMQFDGAQNFGPTASITGDGNVGFVRSSGGFVLDHEMTYQIGGRTTVQCFSCVVSWNAQGVTGELALLPFFVPPFPTRGQIAGEGSITVTGQTLWDQGIIGQLGPVNTPITVEMQGGIALYGNHMHIESLATVRNHGVAVYSGGNFVIAHPSGQFANLPGARFEMQGPRDIMCRNIGFGTPPLGRFVNQGEVIKSGEGDAFLTCVILENQGTLDVQEGQLSVRPTTQGSTPEGGRLILADGLTISSEPIAIEASSWLLGSGEVDAPVEIRGHISPGHPGFGGTPWETARITITGDLSLDSDSRYLAKILDDGGPGIGHDLVVVEGETALGGLLQISLHPDFDPPAGSEFTVLTCGAGCDGLFDQRIISPPGVFFEVLYGDNSVIVRRISEQIFRDAFITPSQGQ